MEGKIFFAFGASQVIFTYSVYCTCHLLILFTLIYMYMYVCVCSSFQCRNGHKSSPANSYCILSVLMSFLFVEWMMNFIFLSVKTGSLDGLTSECINLIESVIFCLLVLRHCSVQQDEGNWSNLWLKVHLTDLFLHPALLLPVMVGMFWARNNCKFDVLLAVHVLQLLPHWIINNLHLLDALKLVYNICG